MSYGKQHPPAYPEQNYQAVNDGVPLQPVQQPGLDNTTQQVQVPCSNEETTTVDRSDTESNDGYDPHSPGEVSQKYLNVSNCEIDARLT